MLGILVFSAAFYTFTATPAKIRDRFDTDAPHSLDGMEFMPYVCLVDKLWAETFGYGLVRKGTIADSFDKCDFRLTKNGSTKVESPVWKKEWDRQIK